jgi:hypothetical protein
VTVTDVWVTDETVRSLTPPGEGKAAVRGIESAGVSTASPSPTLSTVGLVIELSAQEAKEAMDDKKRAV